MELQQQSPRMYARVIIGNFIECEKGNSMRIIIILLTCQLFLLQSVNIFALGLKTTLPIEEELNSKQKGGSYHSSPNNYSMILNNWGDGPDLQHGIGGSSNNQKEKPFHRIQSNIVQPTDIQLVPLQTGTGRGKHNRGYELVSVQDRGNDKDDRNLSERIQDIQGKIDIYQNRQDIGTSIFSLKNPAVIIYLMLNFFTAIAVAVGVYFTLASSPVWLTLVFFASQGFVFLTSSFGLHRYLLRHVRKLKNLVRNDTAVIKQWVQDNEVEIIRDIGLKNLSQDSERAIIEVAQWSGEPKLFKALIESKYIAPADVKVLDALRISNIYLRNNSYSFENVVLFFIVSGVAFSFFYFILQPFILLSSMYVHIVTAGIFSFLFIYLIYLWSVKMLTYYREQKRGFQSMSDAWEIPLDFESLLAMKPGIFQDEYVKLLDETAKDYTRLSPEELMEILYEIEQSIGTLSPWFNKHKKYLSGHVQIKRGERLDAVLARDNGFIWQCLLKTHPNRQAVQDIARNHKGKKRLLKLMKKKEWRVAAAFLKKDLKRLNHLDSFNVKSVTNKLILISHLDPPTIMGSPEIAAFLQNPPFLDNNLNTDDNALFTFLLLNKIPIDKKIVMMKKVRFSEDFAFSILSKNPDLTEDAIAVLFSRTSEKFPKMFAGLYPRSKYFYTILKYFIDHAVPQALGRNGNPKELFLHLQGLLSEAINPEQCAENICSYLFASLKKHKGTVDLKQVQVLSDLMSTEIFDTRGFFANKQKVPADIWRFLLQYGNNKNAIMTTFSFLSQNFHGVPKDTLEFIFQPAHLAKLEKGNFTDVLKGIMRSNNMLAYDALVASLKKAAMKDTLSPVVAEDFVDSLKTMGHDDDIKQILVHIIKNEGKFHLRATIKPILMLSPKVFQPIMALYFRPVPIQTPPALPDIPMQQNQELQNTNKDNDASNSKSSSIMQTLKNKFWNKTEGPAPNLGGLSLGIHNSSDSYTRHSAKAYPGFYRYRKEFDAVQKVLLPGRASNVSMYVHDGVPSFARNDGRNVVEFNKSFLTYPEAQPLLWWVMLKESFETGFSQRLFALLQGKSPQNRRTLTEFQGLVWVVKLYAEKNKITYKKAAKHLYFDLSTYKTAVQGDIERLIDLSMSKEDAQKEKKNIWLKLDILREIIGNSHMMESLTEDPNALALVSLNTKNPALAKSIASMYKKLGTSA